MANVFDPRSKAWILDTTAVVTTEEVQILGWRWTSDASAAGDHMQIGNNQSVPLYAIHSYAGGDNWNDQMYYGTPGRSYNGGFRVTVPNGILCVYLR